MNLADLPTGEAVADGEGELDNTFELPREMELLARALTRVHGAGHTRAERSGIQLYLPCPDCLQRDGKRELQKRHLSIGLERALGLGRYAVRVGTYNADSSAQCMKEGKRFSISELRRMIPIAERGYPEASTVLVQSKVGKCLISDANGNMIPDHPGDVVPLSELSPEHPAIQYLTQRRFNIPDLCRQFRAAFCVREAPEDPVKNRYYKRLQMDFRDTPQNRIIFYADILGVQRGWQARVIDEVHDGLRYYLHPYSGQWVPMEHKPAGKWVPLPQVLNERYPTFDISKYKTAFSASRRDILFGLDAALTWNAQRSGKKKFCILTEGPLDAARFGPPAVAIIGKYLSDAHVGLVMRYFDAVLFAGQNDKYSRTLADAIHAAFASRLPVASIMPMDPAVKDFGDMQTYAAWKTALPALAQLGCSL